jgi:hypothetical protein
VEGHVTHFPQKKCEWWASSKDVFSSCGSMLIPEAGAFPLSFDHHGLAEQLVHTLEHWAFARNKFQAFLPDGRRRTRRGEPPSIEAIEPRGSPFFLWSRLWQL